MRSVSLCLGVAAVVFTSGCTPVLKELRHPGGYPGYVLDKRTFDASGSKQLILLRATLVLAMAADMGQVTVNGQDADSFAKLLATASEEINYAAADLAIADSHPCNSVSFPPAGVGARDDSQCQGFSENFESNLPRIEGRIIKVMLAALPTDKIRKFINDVSGGNVIGAALHLLGAIAKSAGGLHYAAGRYRSGLEVLASSVGNCAPTSGGSMKFDPETMTTVNAAACLGLSEHDLFVNPLELKRDQLSGDNLKVSPVAFYMLMRSIAQNCVRLPYSGTSNDLDASKDVRRTACNSIGFKPLPRPYRIDKEDNRIAPIQKSTIPAGPDDWNPAPSVAPAAVPAPPPPAASPAG